MAQKRYWNWQDDDSTFDLNWRELGLWESGRYRGFEVVGGFSAGLTLTLVHTATGIEKTELGGTTSKTFGVWYTKQGAVITEDAAIALPVSANPSGFGRIDLIVGTHDYVVTIGGATAVYSIIQGTPSASPVAPALPLPLQQVILGTLFVPSGMTSLTDTGVVYTPAIVPNFAGDATVAHTDRDNAFSVTQTVQGLQEVAGVAYIDTAGASNTFEFRNFGGVDADNSMGVYIVQATSSPIYDWRVTGFANAPTAATGTVRRLTIFSPSISLYYDGGFFGGRTYYQKAGTAVTIIFDDSGNRYFEEGDEAALGRVNRFWKQQVFNQKQLSILNPLLPGLVTLEDGYNMYNLGNSAAPLDYISGMSASANFDKGTGATQWGGGMVWLTTGNTLLSIKHLAAGLPVGYKPFFCPKPLGDYYVKAHSVLMFVEDQTYWRLVQPNDAWYDIPLSLVANGGGSIATTGTSYLRVKFSNNSLFVRLAASITVTGTVTSIDIILGLPIAFPSGIQVIAGAIVGSNYSPLFITNSGTSLRMKNDAAAFPAVGPSIFSFSGSFEITI